MNYMVNVNLKRIAKRLGLPPFTFYSARHSYASQLYHANVPIGLIAQNMGRNPNDIQTYLKEFDIKSIVEANNKSLITGQTTYMDIQKKTQESKRDAVREVFKAQGDFKSLEEAERIWKWMDEN